MMGWLGTAFVGYLIGAIPFAYLLTRAMTGGDLRRAGSGNVGAANAQRQAGWAVGLLVLALDGSKGVVATIAAPWVGSAIASAAQGGEATDTWLTLAVVAALSATLGHVFPVWLRLAGGKGAATAGGAFAVLAPLPTIGAAAAFVVIVWRTQFVSLGSLAAAALLPLLASATGEDPRVVAGALCAGALVALRHRENVSRLRRGVERRLGERDAAPAGGAGTGGGGAR